MMTATTRFRRETYLPYFVPMIGDREIAGVVECLRSGWLTTGPKVNEFERQFAEYTGARNAIAVNSCTGGLHVALAALGIGPGDEVIVPALTFCATANVVTHVGAKPVLVDVDRNFGISPEAVRRAITPRTRAILPVHYAGQACELNEILAIGDAHGIPVIEDAAHAAGSTYGGRRIGTHGDAVVFSFYATKNMTTGEGGMITTNDDRLAERMRQFVLHGMNRDAWKRYSKNGSWEYDVVAPGFKYNLMDLQAALGIAQLARLDDFTQGRQRIARRYQEAFSRMPELILPEELPGRNHVYHLYPVRLAEGTLSIDRGQFIDELRTAGIGSSVHFIPLYRFSYYRNEYGYHPDQFPVCEELTRGLFSLPLYPAMTDADVADVIAAVEDIVQAHRLP